jgi:hypothetical protein
MLKIKNFKVIEHWKLSISYTDGLSGEISLLHLKDKPGYKPLNEFNYFSSIKIDSKSGDLVWDNGVSLCKNAIYKQLELKLLAKRLKLDLDKLED